MKLNTGKIAFPIEFDNGNKDCIYFNPNDPDLFSRMRDLSANIDKRIKAMSDVMLGVDGKPENIEYIDAFNALQKILYEELNIAFGSDVSSVVFKYCSPFAIVNGEYFISQFVKAITPEIEKHIEEATAARRAKMDKHLSKYTVSE